MAHCWLPVGPTMGLSQEIAHIIRTSRCEMADGLPGPLTGSTIQFPVAGGNLDGQSILPICPVRHPQLVSESGCITCELSLEKMAPTFALRSTHRVALTQLCKSVHPSRSRRNRTCLTVCRHCKVAVLPGDGIGPEICSVAVDLLRAAGDLEGVDFQFTDALVGGAAIDATGSPLPDETLEICKASDAVLLAAIGG